MSCLVPPATVDEFFEVINSCATLYGGEKWVETALVGLIAVTLVGLAMIGLVALFRR